MEFEGLGEGWEEKELVEEREEWEEGGTEKEGGMQTFLRDSGRVRAPGGRPRAR